MGELYRLIGKVSPLFDENKADADFQDFEAKVASELPGGDFVRVLTEWPAIPALLKSIFSASPYLTGLILREPRAVADILLGDEVGALERFTQVLNEELLKAQTVDDAREPLRIFKRQVALLIAFMDIGQIASVDETARSLSMAASAALNGAVRFLLRAAAARGDFLPNNIEAAEKDSGYVVLGLGKLGAYELNYSSDIDIIVFFEPGKCRLRDGLEPQMFFVRITKDLVKLMQERTKDGYVFRTDLRLRPDPGATQVALSTEAGLVYYESFGQNWERAAMIKARPVAGDLAAGDAFLEELAPFIWRKYLDYAAIADVHAMKRQIHAVKGHGQIAVRGHNLKLGRGGIREIEFFAQTQQLIAGGRQPRLRLRRTLDALDALVQQEWIEAETAKELGAAYWFLRLVEHRLQMIADEQTHSLPHDENELRRVARFSGFADVAQFSEKLEEQLEIVQRHYGALFEDVPGLATDAGNLVFTGDDDDPNTVETLHVMGYPNPSQVIATVKKWHFGRYPATRSPKARERLTELHPVLLAALADTAQPDMALTAFDRFLAELPAGIQLFSLLRNNPPLLTLMADIMGTAPRLASALSRRATLLDGVLDPGFFGHLPSDDALKKIVGAAIGNCGHYQDSLDIARDIGQEQSFLIGARILSGTVSASQAGGAFAHLAEHLIGSLSDEVAREISETYGKVPGGSAAVIAMGKLGGEEMTASSDLDLIVVYDHDEQAKESDGAKPLSVLQYYARFTQRLISALTAPTARGKLYEVDMRLRPSGNSGPVASSYLSFEDYQHHKAWTWEHMALTRARVISGPVKLRARLEALIKQVLCKPRDGEKIASDIAEMRTRISAAKGESGLWDLKNVPGGLVDLEFIAQYKQLMHAHAHPNMLCQNTGLALRRLAGAELLSAEEADILIPASQLYSNLTQILRLCFEGPFAPENAPHGLKSLLAQSAGEPDFERLEIKLHMCEAKVAALFDRLIKMA